MLCYTSIISGKINESNNEISKDDLKILVFSFAEEKSRSDYKTTRKITTPPVVILRIN